MSETNTEKQPSSEIPKEDTGDLGLIDGDMLVTNETLIFQVFGYLHPPGKAIVYLRYVPANLVPLVPLNYEQTTWKYEGVTLARPRTMYSPQDLQIQQEACRRNFPDYLFDDPYSAKTLIAIPRSKIRYVVKPQEAFRRLLEKKSLDPLEATAVRLVDTLSRSSSVAVKDFGLHGSLSLGMHRDFSDIDLTIHGGNNYREVHRTVSVLAEQGILKILDSEKFDALRRNKGIFEGRRFVINAVRAQEEVAEKYGQFNFRPLRHTGFTARVINDDESHFKPAVYQVDDFKDNNEGVPPQSPRHVVSMVSLYRGLVKRGQKMKGEGQIEIVEETNGRSYYTRVVIGTGDLQYKEYLYPAEA